MRHSDSRHTDRPEYRSERIAGRSGLAVLYNPAFVLQREVLRSSDGERIHYYVPELEPPHSRLKVMLNRWNHMRAGKIDTVDR